jgi:ATPase subunit of ABC transporter with duplicated ATPase domains
MRGDALVWEAFRQLQTETDGARLAALEERIAAHDGYTLEARASAILVGLGIETAFHRKPLATLSGGFKLRALLAQVLVGGADVLLLDEPTNHLDILSIRWLEKFLAAYKGCALVISHDQRFLDNVATHILDVDYGTITLYVGNYAAFAVEKEQVRERKEAEIARTEKIIADKQAFVDRFRYKATKARQAQSRLKQIEKIEVEELPQTSRRAPLFKFEPERPSGRDVLEAQGICKAYGERQVLRDVSLAVRRGEKVGVIGPNGLGKSTLLKILTGNLQPDAGQVKWGHEARVSYFAQDHRELLGSDPEVTVLDYLWRTCPMEATTYVRGMLGRVLLSGDAVDKKLGVLSGGEAARLVFARIMVERPNVLVLDEPTNHLDLESIHALAGALQGFEGTVLFVSHDRWFVSQLATRILEITRNGPNDFPGTYAEYLERLGDDHLDADAVVLKAKAARAGDGDSGEKAAVTQSWEEQKRRRNQKKDLPQRRDKVLADVEKAEARIKAIEELYCQPDFFARTSKEEVSRLEEEKRELGTRVEALVKEWETLEAEISELA